MKQFPKRIKAFLMVLMYIAVYVAITMLVELAYVLWQEASGVKSLSEIAGNTSNNLHALSVIGTVVTFWAYLLIGKIRKEPFGKVIQIKKSPLVIYIMAMCMAVGMRFLVNVYFSYSQHIKILKQSIDTAAETMPEIVGGAQVIIAIFSAIVIAPVFEEILFRGIVMNEFMKIMRPWAAITLQGLIFGVIHGVLFQSIFAFVLGVLIGVVYYRTQNIKVAITCHAVFNISVIIAISEFTPVTGAIFAILGVILIVCSMSYIVSRNNQ